MKVFGLEIKRAKRQAAGAELVTSYPFGSGYTAGTGALPGVYRALRIYADLLSLTPLKTKDGRAHYFIDLMRQPCRFATGQNFYEQLVHSYFLFGNFYAKINYNTQGRVTALIPYQPTACRVYPNGNDYGDGPGIEARGIYFRDRRGRILLESDCLHIRDALFTSYNLIESPSRIAIFNLAFTAGRSIAEVQASLSQSGLKSASLMNYPAGATPESLDEVKKVVSNFFAGPQSQSAGNILSLPEGFSIKGLTIANADKALEFLSSMSDLSIARLFSIPVEILHRADGETQAGSQALKEAFRIFAKTSAKAFLMNIARSLSRVAGTELYYDQGVFVGSDLREQSQYLSKLVQAQILKPSEAKEMIQ